MYFMPACFASRAHARCDPGAGWNVVACGAYSTTGMPSSSITHSCRPIVEYTPKWMNIPKRAAFHHFMRSSRLLSPGSGVVAAVVSCAATVRAAPDTPAPIASSDAPVPFSRLRRVNSGFFTLPPPSDFGM